MVWEDKTTNFGTPLHFAYQINMNHKV